MTSILSSYGWNPSLAAHFAALGEQGRQPARVVLEQRGVFRLQTGGAAVDAVLAGRLRHLAGTAEDLPVVGDWVACHQPDPTGMILIDAVLPRSTKLSRKVSGSRAVEQLLAANVDKIFIVMGLDGDFNLRRLERYLVMVRESGARPVVVLNKADLCGDPIGSRASVEEVAGEVPVLVVAALDGDLASLRAVLSAGETVALVGSSGVGKSTLINRLARRELLRTGSVRQRDERGQHTTTHRQLFLLPEGYLLIDSPGLRELQLWVADESLDDAFEDIARLSAGCRFRDCSHGEEPGCAVRGAIEAGELDAKRLTSFHALDREAKALAVRLDVRSKRAADRKLGRLYRAVQAAKRKSR